MSTHTHRPRTTLKIQDVRRLDAPEDVDRLLERLETLLPSTPAARAHRLLADAVRRLAIDRAPMRETAFAVINEMVKEVNTRAKTIGLESVVTSDLDDLIEELHQDILCGDLSSTPAPTAQTWVPTWHPRQLERAHPRYARKASRA